MQRCALLLATLCLALAPFARADQWSKTFTVTGKPELQVETTDASITVDTWDRNTIEATVTTERYKIGEGGIKVYDHQIGNSVELEVRFPHEFLAVEIGSRRVAIQVHMPRQGQVTLHTGDGLIRLSDLKGQAELQSGDGHLEIQGMDGVLRAHSGDGNLSAAGRFDGLQLTTGDGRIDARALPGSTANSLWNLHSGDGSVSLALPDNFAADLDLHTGDGHITLDLPVSVEGKIGENNIHGKLNGGGNPVTIHTGDGSIRVSRL
jgi:DUF4097 and DUF4098 domain-containing protein YvlB